MSLAQLIASRPPMVVRLIREQVAALTNPDVVATLRRELVAQTLVFKTDDYAEQNQARSQDRDPRFEGH